MITFLDVAALEAALKRAEYNHAAFEKHILGGKRDDNWAHWYADFMKQEQERVHV